MYAWLWNGVAAEAMICIVNGIKVIETGVTRSSLIDPIIVKLSHETIDAVKLIVYFLFPKFVRLSRQIVTVDIAFFRTGH